MTKTVDNSVVKNNIDVPNGRPGVDVCLPDVLARSPPCNIDVVVVGGGIGGLSAARECWRLGCNVRVFERQSGPVLSGDSFQIGASALASLKNYPSLEQEVKSIALDLAVVLRKLDGTVVRPPFSIAELMPTVDREVASKFLRLTRPKLYQVMLQHLQRVGVPVMFSHEAIDYYEDVKTRRGGVLFKDGSRHEADVVIAADGAKSASWKIVLGKPVPVRPSGDAIFRAAFPNKYPGILPGFERHTLEDGKTIAVMHLYWGEIQFGGFQNDEEIQWFLVHKDDHGAVESWDHYHSLESVRQLLSHYKDFSADARRMIELTPKECLIDWRIMWRDPQPQWTSPGGHIIQLGDAAHTFHPSSGNGGTQAMEDAISLAQCIAMAGKDDIPWALRVHTLLRFERVSCLQAFGIANQAERVKSQKLPSIGNWVALHDPSEYAVANYADALRHLEEGTPFKNTNVPKGMKYVPWTIDGLVEAHERGEPTVLDGEWS